MDDDNLRIGLIDPVLLRRRIAKTALESFQIAVQDFGTIVECIAADVEADILVVVPPVLMVGPILEDIRALRERHNLPVVIIASADPHREGHMVREILRGGASGYIANQTTDLPTAVAALRFVKSGGMYMPLDNILQGQQKKPAEKPPGSLTPRQLDVLEKLRQGKPNKLIAYELGITESTAKVHIRVIMKRYKAHNRTEAVYKSQRMDIAAA